MPRACPVEAHVRCYLAENVRPPRPKAVASILSAESHRCSDHRDALRDKPVASSEFEVSPWHRSV
jgi:hypothetical protein